MTGCELCCPQKMHIATRGPPRCSSPCRGCRYRWSRRRDAWGFWVSAKPGAVPAPLHGGFQLSLLEEHVLGARLVAVLQSSRISNLVLTTPSVPPPSSISSTWVNMTLKQQFINMQASSISLLTDTVFQTKISMHHHHHHENHNILIIINNNHQHHHRYYLEISHNVIRNIAQEIRGVLIAGVHAQGQRGGVDEVSRGFRGRPHVDHPTFAQQRQRVAQLKHSSGGLSNK